MGILLSIYNCGIISSYRTIYGSESISQTCGFLLDIIDFCPIECFPNYIAYDTACQLKQYVTNQVKRLTNENKNSDRLNLLSSTKMVVDKFHFCGHVAKFCKENCDPNIAELKNINTEACEQENKWLAGYKHILNHMNLARYSFLLFCLFDDRNNAKMNFENIFNK